MLVILTKNLHTKKGRIYKTRPKRHKFSRPKSAEIQAPKRLEFIKCFKAHSVFCAFDFCAISQSCAVICLFYLS